MSLRSRARSARSFISFAASFTLASGLVPASVFAQGSLIPTPESVLGYRVGADRKLADWPQIVGYFEKLAAATPAVSIETLGKTTMGKPLIAAIISTPENVKRREEIFAAQRKLADPRILKSADEAALYAHQPAVLVIQCNIHSDEIASSQMAMELAYRLATNDTLQAELKSAVVILIPSVNPDGEEMVVEWYRSQLGTKWEGGEMPWIYNKYTGHDDNRDWFMMTQVETRLVTAALYKRWLPEIFYDVHQMGAEGARLFVPPFLDPVDPNIDPLIVRGIGLIGAEMSSALESRGKTGVVDHAVYDMWWHGGARSTPARHNMIGLLTEAASVKVATPIVQVDSELTGHERGLPKYERTVDFPICAGLRHARAEADRVGGKRFGEGVGDSVEAARFVRSRENRGGALVGRRRARRNRQLDHCTDVPAVSRARKRFARDPTLSKASALARWSS